MSLMTSKSEPSINIWQALELIKLKVKGKDFIIKKRELLFLLAKDGSGYIFATESGEKVKISKKAELEKKIIRLFTNEQLPNMSEQ